MNCPFLQEARVRSCLAAGLRKMLMQATPAAEEICSSAAYTGCPVYQSHEPPDAPTAHCPFLHESHVQFCAAASVSRPVPYSESTLLRCGSSGHRYCDVYLAFAQPPASAQDCVEGLEVPPHLRFTPNHMWIDIAEDGAWRIGIDALLAHAVGDVNAVSFITGVGPQGPAAILGASGVDLNVTFPHPVTVAECNMYLRADPSRIVKAPYTSGWLFRGDKPPGRMQSLVTGDEARRWMQNEMHRASVFVHDRIGHSEAGTAADGGTVERGFLTQLGRDHRLAFFDSFFSSWLTRTRQ